MISTADHQTGPPGVSSPASTKVAERVETAKATALTKQQERLRISALFSQYRQTHDVDLRDQLIQLHLGVVRYVAAKFAGRGESFEDLNQVGCIGLMKAVERFDPERGFQFVTFAFPTITGEIQRYFRDIGWAIRVPRAIQERWVVCDKAVEALTRQYGRSPTIPEIAARIGVPEELVLEAQEARQSRTLASIDALQSTDRDTSRMLNSLRCVDPNLEAVEEHLFMNDLLACLSSSERLLIELRFQRQMSQRDIAHQLGVSQMQVSRLLNRALPKLREVYRKLTGHDPSTQPSMAVL